MKQELVLVTQLFLGGELQAWSSELLLVLVNSKAGCWTKEEKLAGAAMLLLRICAKVAPLDTRYAAPRLNIFWMLESISVEMMEAWNTKYTTCILRNTFYWFLYFLIFIDI